MLEAALAFLVGLLIGSFLNVCIYRMPRDLSVARPRSFCPTCRHTVVWYDNIPLFSYLALGAKCRHCGARISLRYPVVELLTGALVFAAVHSLGVSLAAAKLSVFGALVVALIFSDLEERILPDEFTLGGTALGLLAAMLVPMEEGIGVLIVGEQWGATGRSVAESLLGAMVASGAMWLVGTVYHRIRRREGLGFGDVKMVAMIGAFLGLQRTLLTLLVGSVAGSVGGLLYILMTRKNPSTYELPFGSFLGAAAILVAFFGNALVNYHLPPGG